MKSDKKKDPLTDVVEITTAPQNDDLEPKAGDGQTVTSIGEVVTLGMDKEITEVARKLVKEAKKKKQ